MCSLAGIVDFNNHLTSKDRTIKVKNMQNSLKHRGPDGSGIYQDQKVTMAHNQLAISCNTTDGHQPITDKTGRFIMCFNGEIYSYGNNDTKQLINNFSKHKDKIFQTLDGIFAIAIWDKKKRSLTLTRDPLGIKPIYYYEDKINNTIYFASQALALSQALNIKPEINPNSVRNYLKYSHIQNENTIFQDIKKLQPGFIAKWN